MSWGLVCRITIRIARLSLGSDVRFLTAVFDPPFDSLIPDYDLRPSAGKGAVMTFNIRLIMIPLIALAGHAPSVSADELDDGASYEEIVRDLSRGSSQTNYEVNHPFDEIKFHFGAAFAQTMFSFVTESGESRQISQGGAGLNLGMDLFSKNWVAEGHFYNYGQINYGPSQISVREFGLRITYQDRLARRWGYRASSGLAARYIDEKGTLNGVGFERSTNSPAMLFAVGPQFHLTDTWSISAEAAARSPLQDGSAVSTAGDFGFRVDGHF
jgi:hypothetical protein